MDGNFSAEHMKHRTGEQDVSLSAGMAFMANPESYKAHLRSGTEIAQVFRTSMPDCHYSWSNSPAHATLTEQLNRQTPVGAPRYHRYWCNCMLPWLLCPNLCG